MIIVGIRELKQRASELVRLVRQDNQQVQITYRGKVVALLVPVERPDQDTNKDTWSHLDVLAAEIGANWPNEVSSVEAVTEGRE